MRHFGFLWLALAILLGVQARADQREARANQREARAKLSDECYDILHEKVEASAEVRQECLSQFYGVTTIVISANRRAEEFKTVAAPVSVVQAHELERKTFDNVADALRDLAGIEISDAGEAGQKRIRIRGEQARRVMLLIDGQEFDDQREVGTPLLIAPEMIDRIEVVRGPGSVLYGSKAIGGVVNIITKKGGYHPVQGSASTSYQTSTNGWQHFASAYGSHQSFDYRIAAVGADHGQRDTPGGDLENTAFSNESLMGYLGGNFGKHKLGVTFDLYQSESDVFVEDQVRFKPPFLDFAIDIPKRDRNKVGVFYDWQDISETLEKLHLDFYLQESEREFNTFSKTKLDVGFPLLNETSISSPSELDNYGMTAQSDWRIGKSNTLVAGYQLTRDDLSEDRLRSVVSNGVAKPDEFVEDEATRSSHSVFAQDEWRMFDDLALTLGGRFYWLDAELERTTRPGLAPNSVSDTDGVLSAGLAYSGFDDATIWARVAQGYLYPTLTELASGAFAGPDYVNPNPGLKPENSINYDAGVRYFSGGVSLDLSAFFSEAQDLIDFVKCSEASIACLEPAGRNDRVYLNVDKAKSFGAESTLSYNFESVTPYASLAYLRRKESTQELSTYQTGMAPVTTRLGLRWDGQIASNVGAWADLFMRASGDSDEQESIAEVTHKAGWATLNAAGGVAFGAKRQARLSVEILNLTDKQYVPATENLTAAGVGALLKFALDF